MQAAVHKAGALVDRACSTHLMSTPAATPALPPVSPPMQAAVHKAGALVDRAYRAIASEAPGADVSGEGAPLKDLPEGEWGVA